MVHVNTEILTNVAKIKYIEYFITKYNIFFSGMDYPGKKSSVID